MTQNLPYNNLGEFLDFVSHVRSERQSNPARTLQEAWNTYRPNLNATFQKYRSGRCLSLSTTFCEELSRLGVSALTTAKPAINPWYCLPVPGSEEDPSKWHQFSQSAQEVDHSSALILFKDENGHDGVMRFECSFEKDCPTEMEEFLGNDSQSGADRFQQRQYHSNPELTPNRVMDPSLIGKMHLRGRSKMVMKTAEGKILGVDLLRGNLYMNGAWTKTNPSIPVNAQGQVSIDLASLAHPDEKGTYYIEGKAVTLSHREALHQILQAASHELTIPDTMEEDLIGLAQMTPELFQTFLLEPLPLIQRYYNQLLPIGKVVIACRTNQMQGPPVHIDITRKQSQLLRLHNNITGAFKQNDPQAVELAIGAFNQAHEELKELEKQFSQQKLPA